MVAQAVTGAPEGRRAVVLALRGAGVSDDWTAHRLREIESSMLTDQDVEGRVRECCKQAEAWLDLGDSYSAKTLLTRMLQLSFGIGYAKDYQLDRWIEWLGRMNEIEPELAANRIAWFSEIITAVNETTEGEATHQACRSRARERRRNGHF